MDLPKDFIVGICMEMCSEDEIDMREREKLLHKFEILAGTENHARPKADRKHMIKSFSRSAAGKIMNVPEHIRPPNVLLKTVYYLLHELRAVRQDLVIQNAPAAQYVAILQPIVRFHAYSSYRLCEENHNAFDPHINSIHLQECLKRLLCAYDDCSHLYEIDKDNEDISDHFLKENRPYFESLYIIVNLGNVSSITRGLKLSKIWKTELVRLSLDISLSYSRNNFLKVCHSVKKLPALHTALLYLQLPELRRKALKIMSVAYNSRNLAFPSSVLKRILLYESTEETMKDCEYYGLKVTETAVCFMKTDFNVTRDKVPPKKSRVIDQQLDKIDVCDLLLYNI